MCGLPGTGKDTWIASHCPSLPVVSLDAVRAELGIPSAGPQKRVVDAAKAQAKTLLRERRPFVWNATNVSADLRRGLVELFTGYHASVRIVYLEMEWGKNCGATRTVPPWCRSPLSCVCWRS